MKFILPTGESQSLSIEFIASNLKIEYSKAADKKCQFEKLLAGKLKTPGEITLVDLMTVTTHNYAAEKKIDHCIDELVLLLYKSFPHYFDNKTRPSTDALSAYLVLNKNSKKLGYDVAASEKKEKKITSVDPNTYSYSSHSSLFPKVAQNISKIKSYQTILDEFSLLGFFNGYENKLKVSDSLNIIGKTFIEFPSSISFEEIQKIAEKLQSMGLKCEASSLIGLQNGIKISLTVIELEIWLINKVIETKEPKIHSITPEAQSLLFFGSQEEKSINQNTDDNIKDDRQNCSTVTQELFLNLVRQ